MVLELGKNQLTLYKMFEAMLHSYQTKSVSFSPTCMNLRFPVNFIVKCKCHVVKPLFLWSLYIVKCKTV